MRWTINSIGTVLLSLGMAGLVPITALQADPIVIKYEGPSSQSYKPGKKLVPNTKINLKSGEILTVLDERGTRTLRGPGTFSASSPSNGGTVSQTSLARLIKTSSVSRARTGAVRGGPSDDQVRTNPNLWFIDISKSAKICVADFQNIQLWRSNTQISQQITTADSRNGGYAPVIFRKGEASVRWPSSVTPTEKGRYTIAVQGESAIVDVELVKVDITGEETLDIMAAKLLDKGCQVQSEQLAATFAQSDATPTGG